MKFIDLLEAVDLNSAYVLSKPIITRIGIINSVSYKFTPKSGHECVIMYSSIYSEHTIEGYKINWISYCKFEDDRGLIDTNDYDPLRVLATVLKASYEFIKEFKPEAIKYSGWFSKKEDELSSSSGIQSKRTRIYNNLVKNNLNKIPDYKFIEKGDESYLIYTGEIPIKGAHKIFKHPKKVTDKNKKMKLTEILVELVEEGKITDERLIDYIYEQQETLDEGFKETAATLAIILASSFGMNKAKANTVANSIPKDKIESVKKEVGELKKGDTTELKNVIKGALSNSGDEYKSTDPEFLEYTEGKEPIMPAGYKETTEDQRKAWNEYLDYLKGEGLLGEKILDKGTAGGSTRGKDELKKYIEEKDKKARKNLKSKDELKKYIEEKGIKNLSLSMVPFIQYEFKLMKSGKKGFGLNQNDFKKLTEVLFHVIPNIIKTKGSDADGNPGSVTTTCFYPSYNGSYDLKAYAAKFAKMSIDAFRDYLDNLKKVNKGHRASNPTSAADEKKWGEEHARKIQERIGR